MILRNNKDSKNNNVAKNHQQQIGKNKEDNVAISTRILLLEEFCIGWYTNVDDWWTHHLEYELSEFAALISSLGGSSALKNVRTNSPIMFHYEKIYYTIH